MATKRPTTARDDGEPSPDVPTTEEALGDTAPQRPHDAPSTKPNTFMKSTWHEGQNQLTLLWPNPFLAILYDLMYKGTTPRVSGKIPVNSCWAQHAFVFPRALPPLIYHWYDYTYRGQQWSWGYAYTVYVAYFILFSKMSLSHFNYLVEKYGTLDDGKPRDQVPDSRKLSTIFTLVAYAFVRPLIGIAILFDPKEAPKFNPWWPVHGFFFTIILDLYFYIYHRSAHEIDWLWRIHKTHHMTKHPSSILSAFADWEQDVIEIFMVPALTLLTYKVDFATWWIINIYVIFVESSGHSGARLFIQSPITSPILQYFDMDLLLEDHDLHHRNGWRKSANYGKQTRVWDKLFGTTRNRVECTPDNIDWNNRGDWLDLIF